MEIAYYLVSFVVDVISDVLKLVALPFRLARKVFK